MGYSQALSGLGAASDELDTVGNNIANSSTYGFKSGSVMFADMYANSVANAVTPNAGIGVRNAGVQQNFGQGTFTTTANPYDVAINGNGFFRMSVNGVIEYSRNGQFHSDPNGYIVNAEGANLTGYPANGNGAVSTTTPVPLRIDVSGIAPVQSTTISSNGVNLDSSQAYPKTTPFDPTDSTSYSYTTQATAYDSLGNAHQMTMYFVRDPQPTPPVTPATVNFSVYAAEDGTLVPPTPPATTAGLVGDLQFNSAGSLTSFVDANGNVGTGSAAYSVSMSLSSATGSNTPFPVTLDLQGATAYAGIGNSAALNADGNKAGNYAGVKILDDGTVEGVYDNGSNKVFGKIVLANFINPNGLKPVGDNEWVATNDSGPADLGTPGTGPMGSLLSEQLENSNVNLTSNLVDLITTQRFYQANAQSIKTQNTVDQTLLNM
ncbi:Flagellar hook protein FlgE [Pararobbsia alpina]|uniref:flagellar hook protein FlgE n=1 Tax=Pararobbsia alpina TaxID=621374 RepID=UPI0039A44724